MGESKLLLFTRTVRGMVCRRGDGKYLSLYNDGRSTEPVWNESPLDAELKVPWPGQAPQDFFQNRDPMYHFGRASLRECTMVSITIESEAIVELK